MTMIALSIPQEAARKLAVPGGEKAEDLHITLVYLGDLQGYTGKLLQVVRDFALTNPSVAGTVNGGGTFTGRSKPVSWAYFDSIPLAQFRQNLINRLKMAGIPIRPTHGWVPHITLAYGQVLDIEEIPNIPIRFDRVSLHLGQNGDKVRFPLMGATYKEVSASPTTAYGSGPTGLYSQPGLGKRKKGITRTEQDGKHPAAHYLIVEDPNKPTTWRLRIRDANGKLSRRLLGAAKSALTSNQGPGKRQALVKLRKLEQETTKEYDLDLLREWSASHKHSLKKSDTRSRLTARFGKQEQLLGLKKKVPKIINTKEHSGSLTVFKDANGQDRWLAITTNAFRDRDEEIVSTKALEADVARADATKDYGPLRFWHTPGIELGTTDFNAMQGRMLIESGIMTNPGAAQKLKEFPERYKMSVGFRHPPDEPDPNGIFYNIRRFERSILPADRAANQLTSISIHKESDLMDDMKLKALKSLVGEAQFDAIVNQATTAEKQADGMNIAYKDAENMNPQELLDFAIDNFASWEQSTKMGKKPKMDEEEEEDDEDEEEETTKMGDMDMQKKMYGEMKQCRDDMRGYANQMKMYAEKMGKPSTSTKEAKEREELQKQVHILSTSLKETMRKLGELTEEQPPMAGYRPTQAGETVLAGANAETFKSGDTAPPPMDGFLDFMTNGANGGAA